MIRTKKKFALLSCLIFLSVFIFSCKSDSTAANDDPGFFDFSSDTDKAIEIVRQANDELMRVKILYNENQSTLQELKEASQKGETERVKTLSKALVDAITTGFVFADSAKSKIREAQELNIHQDYKDYLSLEEQSLDRQVEAFQFLYDAASLLNQTTGSPDKQQAEKAALVFKEKEENFEKTMEEAKKINEQADKLYGESMKRWQEQNR